MKNILAPVLFLSGLLLLGGCKKNPVERLVNPYSDSTVPELSGTFTLYDDELKTGGGVGFIPAGENQEIDFSDSSSPRRSARQVRYAWNGNDTTDASGVGTQHLFGGFTLVAAPTIGEAELAPARNLSAASYTKLKFWVRATLASENTLRIEGPDDGDAATVASRVEFTGDQVADWTEVELSVPSADFNSVRSFLTVSIQYEQPPRTTVAGGGGIVFLDDVRYE